MSRTGQPAWDYIIGGGDSAGCVLANRLSEDPGVRVLLLEAGGSDRHPLYRLPAGFAKMTLGMGSWGWHTVPQTHLGGRVLRFTQAKVIGGGSTINAQIYTRGHPADYDEWAREDGATGWAYADVLPYFKRAENNQRFANAFHGDQGPLGVSNPRSPLPICEAFFRAGQALGMPFNPDFNGERQEGLGYYQLTQLDARRSSTATAYLKPARRRPNLSVMLNAQVLKLTLEAGRAVGANLQDHIDLFVIAECSGNHSYDRYKKPHHAALAALRYLLLRDGPLASSLFETGGFWFAQEAARARSPDIQFHLGLGSGIEAGVARMPHGGVTLNATLMRPHSRGSLRLASADPAAPPLIDPAYWSDPRDRAASLAGLRLAREIIGQPALRPFIRSEVLPGPASSNTNAAAIMIAEKAADLILGRPAP